MFSLAVPLLLALTTGSLVVSGLPPAAPSPGGVPQPGQETTRRQTSTDDCADVHVFLARGTGEDYPGRQISVVYAICNSTATTGTSTSTTCDYEDIVYPASLLVPEYCTSVGDGVEAGTDQITAYASRCPDAQLVLSGYSQGAQVTGNILGGQLGGSTGCTDETGTGFDPTTAPASLIKAVTLFGDVTHVANQTYNTASGADSDGLDPRTGTQLERLNEYSDLLQSWCLEDDPVCAQGDNASAHESYFDIYSEAAGEWVVGKLTL